MHIGTGNYHATTARVYEDVGLFTADPEISADIADLFNFVTGFGRPQRFRKLLVAPFNLRKRLIEHIREVAAAAEAGKHARIRIKCNSLTHVEVIDELYEASAGGRGDRHRRARELHARPGRARDERERFASARSSAASSSTAGCTASRRATRRRTCSGAPT